MLGQTARPSSPSTVGQTLPASPRVLHKAACPLRRCFSPRVLCIPACGPLLTPCPGPGYPGLSSPLIVTRPNPLSSRKLGRSLPRHDDAFCLWTVIVLLCPTHLAFRCWCHPLSASNTSPVVGTREEKQEGRKEGSKQKGGQGDRG